MRQCDKAKTSTPNAKWLRDARACFDAVGAPAYLEVAKAWLPGVGTPVYDDRALVKGMLWCSGFADDAGLSSLLGDLGVAAFTKEKEWQGARSLVVGNACAWALGASKASHAHAQLARLKQGTRYRNAKAQVDKAAERAAASRGVTREELDELAAPTFEGAVPSKLGRWSPQLRWKDETPSLTWVRDDGKTSASAPAEVKRDHAEALAQLKGQLAKMKELMPGHVARLEELFATDRALTFEQWQTRYVGHAFVGLLARPLVWRFGDTPGVWMDGDVLGADGARLEVPPGVEVRLWHPAGRAPEEVTALKALVARLGVAAPFAQVDRSTFALTDGEARGGNSGSTRWPMRWGGSTG